MRNIAIVFIGTAILVTGCGGGGDGAGGNDSANDRDSESASSQSTSINDNSSNLASQDAQGGSALIQPSSSSGRLLASNCFQCHGTGGIGGFERIRGEDANEVRDFLNRPASDNIMAAHAQGFTPEQLSAIINYLQQ